MEFRLLGPLEVIDERGCAIDLGRPRQRALLVMLVVHANRLVSMEAIVDGLWGDEPPVSAANSVQGYVSRLRKVLTPAASIATAAHGYRLEVPAEAIDAHRFELLLADGRAALERGEARRACAEFAAGLGLWRGPALAEFAEPFARAVATRLRHQLHLAEEELVQARLMLGEHAGLVAELERMVADDPLSERRWAQLMTALYRAGRPAESLQAYRRARQILVGELGIEPGPQLRQLEADVLAQSPGLAARPSAVPTNLPSRSASFVGRQREMAELESALMESRLVTLTGPGGCGKTSLAVAACRRVLPDFVDGVWFADLAPLASASPVPDTVAAVLGVHQRPDRTLTETVAEYVGAQRALLVLDNCEHVLESCGQLVDTVLRAGRAVRVVATSREPFGLAGEVVWQVPLLTETDAVTLFTERARSARPGVAWPASHRDTVTSICARLDRLPLAIELAAAQLNVLSVGQISDRLGNALGLLDRPVRGAVPRQRTLRDALAWSYDLLTPAEKMLFERLSVFPGSFTLEAAEAVGTSRSLPAEDAVGFFTRLVHKSLVLRADERADGESPRYRLLETVREFGRSRLAARTDGTASEAVASHAAYYLGVARQIESGLRQAGARRWLDLAAAEHHNFRAAIEAMLADQGAGGEVAGRFAGALAWGWFLGGRISEPRQWAEAVLARTAGEVTEARGLALLAGALLASAQSDLDTMTTLSAELSDLGSRLGSAHLEATGLDLLGIACWAQGRLDASIEAHRRSVALFASYGNQAWQAMGYAELGRALADADRPGEARDAHEHAIALARLTNEDAALGFAFDASAAFALTAGDLDRAASMIPEAVEHYRRSGYREGLASGLNTAGTVCAARDDLAGASASFQEALAVCRQIGHLGGAATALAGLADIADRHGQPGRAVRMYAAAAELRRRAGVTLSARLQAHVDAAIGCLQGLLGPSEFGSAWSAGREVTIDQAGRL